MKSKYSSVQKTLNSINFIQFNNKVLNLIFPIVLSNIKVRAKSLNKAGSHILY